MNASPEPELCPTCEMRKGNVGRNVHDIAPLLRGLSLIAVEQDGTRERQYYGCASCPGQWTTVTSLDPMVRATFLFFGEGDKE
jgi:hypothetical protein